MKQKAACTVTAGFASADITPKEGTHLCGGTLGEYRPARFVRHKLFAKLQPFGPDISHLESPMDDEVGVVCFKDGMDIVSSMLHFTCHPGHETSPGYTYWAKMAPGSIEKGLRSSGCGHRKAVLM